MVFFNFLNFLTIFLELSISRRVGTEQNDNYYFLPFLAFSYLFCLKESHNGIFKFFKFFYYSFGIFYYALGTERNGMTVFIFSLSLCFTTNFGLKWSQNGIF